MAARKLVRDLLLARQPLLGQRKPAEGLYTTSRLLVDSRWSGYRRFGVFNNVKEEVNRNPELQKSVKELKEKAKELKEKAGEFKGVKDYLRVRTKQTTEKLYKHVDGVWTGAEASAKKVSSSVKEKISAATEEELSICGRKSLLSRPTLRLKMVPTETKTLKVKLVKKQTRVPRLRNRQKHCLENSSPESLLFLRPSKN